MDVSLPAHRRERACVQLFDVMTLLKTSLYKGGGGIFCENNEYTHKGTEVHSYTSLSVLAQN